MPSFTTYNSTGMESRSVSSEAYRFGFNGMEKDPEITGQEGSHYTAAFWEYDTRIGRRWNVDPVVKEHESPYATFANNPIWFTDPNGSDTISTDQDYRLRIDEDGNLINDVDAFLLDEVIIPEIKPNSRFWNPTHGSDLYNPDATNPQGSAREGTPDSRTDVSDVGMKSVVTILGQLYWMQMRYYKRGSTALSVESFNLASQKE